MNKLIKAAEAVVARCDTPYWKDVSNTEDHIQKLREALADIIKQKTNIYLLMSEYAFGDWKTAQPTIIGAFTTEYAALEASRAASKNSQEGLSFYVTEVRVAE